MLSLTLVAYMRRGTNTPLDQSPRQMSHTPYPSAPKRTKRLEYPRQVTLPMNQSQNLRSSPRTFRNERFWLAISAPSFAHVFTRSIFSQRSCSQRLMRRNSLSNGTHFSEILRFRYTNHTR